MNFDVFSTLYKRYLVTGCKVTLRGTSSGNGFVGLVPHTTSGELAAVTMAELIERGNATITTWVPSPNAGQSISHYFDIGQIFGVSHDRVGANTDFDAPTTGSPGLAAYVTLITQACDLTSAQAVTGLVTLEFDCIFWDRNVTSTN